MGRHLRALATLGMAGLWFLVRGAAAAPASDEPTPRPPAPPPPLPASFHRVGFELGLGSAVGTTGLTYWAAPNRWLRAEVGIGHGFTGLQLSVMPKVALGSFLVGAGLSFSRGEDAHDKMHEVFWANLDALGYELRWPGGLSLVLIGGATIPLTDHHVDYSELGHDVAAGTIIPQGRVSLGWRF